MCFSALHSVPGQPGALWVKSWNWCSYTPTLPCAMLVLDGIGVAINEKKHFTFINAQVHQSNSAL